MTNGELIIRQAINEIQRLRDENDQLKIKSGEQERSIKRDTVREVLRKLIYNITANNTNDGYLSESVDYSSTIEDIKELAAQYGVEVEE